ncbi:MAG: glycosyltransferase family 4 protein [Patescibacteria group bacterium]
MKIVFLSDDFPPISFGGAGISTYELALEMKRAGHEVFIITTCRGKSEAGEFDYRGLRIFQIMSNYSNRWRAYISLYNRSVVRQVEKILANLKPNIVYANNLHQHLSYYSLKLAKKYAQVLVWTARDVMSFNYGKLTTKRYLKNFDSRTTWWDHLKQARKRWNPFRNFLIRRYLRYPDKLLAVSDSLRRALEQNGIKNVGVIQTGIDLGSYHTILAQVSEFKRNHKLENKKVIFFGGRLSEAKGGGKAVEIMSKIVKTDPNVTLVIVGRIDGYTEKLKELAGRLGVVENLIFTGWVERTEMKTAYASADIVLVPSICLDAFPRVILEAMAAGKPVVGTCYGGAPEIIEDGITGYVVNPFNIKKMAGKIIDLLKNPEKAGKFGKAGYERIRTNFNLREKVDQIISNYEPKTDN